MFKKILATLALAFGITGAMAAQMAPQVQMVERAVVMTEQAITTGEESCATNSNDPSVVAMAMQTAPNSAGGTMTALPDAIGQHAGGAMVNPAAPEDDPDGLVMSEKRMNDDASEKPAPKTLQ
jgi:hypothetical protein